MGFTDIFRIKRFKDEIVHLQQEKQQMQSELSEAQSKLQEMGAYEYYEIKAKTNSLKSNYEVKEKQLEDKYVQKQADLDRLIIERTDKSQEVLEHLTELRTDEAKILKNIKTQTNKLNRSKELVKAINYTFENFFNYSPEQNDIKLQNYDLEELEEISPSVILKLHCMDVKDLRKAYRLNDKQINSVLEKYAARYTTKANQAIYKLMVIALRAELQNILYNLKFEKLDKSIDDVKTVTQKYLKIAGDGNQSIAGTLTKFIGEIEYLFINAVKIEYNYYVKKEQARQEQLALREQMRQEAEERKK